MPWLLKNTIVLKTLRHLDTTNNVILKTIVFPIPWFFLEFLKIRSRPLLSKPSSHIQSCASIASIFSRMLSCTIDPTAILYRAFNKQASIEGNVLFVFALDALAIGIVSLSLQIQHDIFMHHLSVGPFSLAAYVHIELELILLYLILVLQR